MMKRAFTLLIPILMMASSAMAVDLFENWLNLYNPLLAKYVSMGTKDGIQSSLVDYDGLRNDSKFREATYALARLPSFETLSKDDQLAMWINAYNFLAMKIVVENPKIKSIKDLDTMFSSIWKKKVGVVAKTKYSLDEIEKDIILAQFNEPRAHFGIVCVSLSCPNIANYAYQGKYLNEQLDHQAKAFLSNQSKGMSISGKKIYLSKIFKWYGEDFPPSVKKWLNKNGFITNDQVGYGVSYMRYNWALNSTKN